MSPFTSLFLVVLVCTIAMQQWLGRRQIAHVTAHRNKVPTAFSSSITLEAHQKAADYSVSKTRLGLVESAAQSILLVLLTLGGILQWVAVGLSCR